MVGPSVASWFDARFEAGGNVVAAVVAVVLTLLTMVAVFFNVRAGAAAEAAITQRQLGRLERCRGLRLGGAGGVDQVDQPLGGVVIGQRGRGGRGQVGPGQGSYWGSPPTTRISSYCGEGVTAE